MSVDSCEGLRRTLRSISYICFSLQNAHSPLHGMIIEGNERFFFLFQIFNGTRFSDQMRSIRMHTTEML